ncbi:hypothetical protein GCM10022293_12740 [Azospirillum formosense]
MGQGAEQRDERDGGGHRLALAVTGRQEVRDGGDVLGFGDADDLVQQRPAQREEQNRTDIEGQEAVAAGRGHADAAEKGPGGAIDGERQRIEDGARTPAIVPGQTVARSSVAP